MRKPISIRSLTATEQQALQEGLRSSEAFVLRRCQILFASARGQHARRIAEALGCDDQTVRNALQAFNARGWAALQRQSSAPHQTPHAVFTPARREQLQALLHQSPRTFGQPTRVWTLDLAAEVAAAQGMRPGASVASRFARPWRPSRRAGNAPNTGAPAPTRPIPGKKQRDRLIRLAATHPTWALGFGDEVWWSRLAQPTMPAWAPGDDALRLGEKARPKADPAPQALACDGLLLGATPTTPDQLWGRCATGQPVRGLTTQLLAWNCDRLAALAKHVLLRVWDNASWHSSQEVRTWLRGHNRHVKQTGRGGRMLACRLPSKSPWLHPIEPKWVHGKRAVVEPARVLTAQEVAERVCAYYGCVYEAHLSISEKAA
jgi:transposase